MTSIGVPDDAALDLESRHAGIVHRGDAAADHGAAEPDAASQRTRQGDVQADAGEHDCRDQRQEGERDVVAARYARFESEHGDEMRGPDAEAGGRGGYAEPDFPHRPGRPADVVEEIDRGKGCEQADDRREHDQTQIVFLHDAGIDFQHKSSPTTAEITQGCISSYLLSRIGKGGRLCRRRPWKIRRLARRQVGCFTRPRAWSGWGRSASPSAACRTARRIAAGGNR